MKSSNVAAEVRLEQQSPNDEGYRVVSIGVAHGGKVVNGTVLGEVEGAKATLEIEAPAEGYVHLVAQPGERLPIGALFAVIATNEDFALDEYLAAIVPVADAVGSGGGGGDVSGSLMERATAKAGELIARHNLGEEAFAGLDLITVADVERILAVAGRPSNHEDELLAGTSRSIQRLAVIGAGRAALQVFDASWNSQRQTIVRMYDEFKAGTGFTLGGVGVAGGFDPVSIAADYQAGAFDAAIIALGDGAKRFELFTALFSRGVPFANVIHPTALIGLNAVIGVGNVIMGNVLISACAKVGDNNLISAFCNIEHHNVVGDHNTFGPGVMTSGTVKIGSQNRFGTGIFVEPGLSIGSNSVVASGCVITRNVPSETLVATKSNVVFRPRS